MLIVVLALTAIIRILNKHSRPAIDNRIVVLGAVNLNQPNSGHLFPPHESREYRLPSVIPVQVPEAKTSFSVIKRDGGECWEVTLIIVGVIQTLWNLLKLAPRCLWRKALRCLCRARGGREHGDRPVGCTVGAYRIVLLLVGDDEDQAHDNAVEQLPPKSARRFREFVKKSLGDLLVTLLLLACTIVYVATYDHFYTEYFASAMTGLYFTNVVLQALCIALPYMKTCGPLSITVNYTRSARRDYQYQIRLPWDEVKKPGNGKQSISVSAA